MNAPNSPALTKPDALLSSADHTARSILSDRSLSVIHSSTLAIASNSAKRSWPEPSLSMKLKNLIQPQEKSG